VQKLVNWELRRESLVQLRGLQQSKSSRASRNNRYIPRTINMLQTSLSHPSCSSSLAVGCFDGSMVRHLRMKFVVGPTSSGVRRLWFLRYHSIVVGKSLGIRSREPRYPSVYVDHSIQLSPRSSKYSALRLQLIKISFGKGPKNSTIRRR